MWESVVDEVRAAHRPFLGIAAAAAAGDRELVVERVTVVREHLERVEELVADGGGE